MTAFIISYDLRKNRDYQSLITAIKAYWTWAKVLESTWVVITNDTAELIRNNLQLKMDADDGLFVIKSWHDAAWYWVLCDWNWLINNL